MPVYRTPDGKIVEEKPERSARVFGGDATRKPSAPPVDGASGTAGVEAGRPDDRTVRAGARSRDEDFTRLVGRPGSRVDGTADRQVPVTGWLVVVAGAGTGQSVALGLGKNDIGRGATARVRLDFGDTHISREAHAIVTYEPRGRRFYISDGSSQGDNLTYLNDQPVLAPMPLDDGAEIQLGETRLRFVPLCGPAFDWSDLDGSVG